MTRFNSDANTVEDAIEYFKNRSLQLIADKFIWSNKVKLLKNSGDVWGLETYYLKDNIKYFSVYTLFNSRGKSLTKNYLIEKHKSNCMFVTVPPCGVFNYLNTYVNTRLACKHLDSAEYLEIQNNYSNTKAKRSQQYLMNHIDEGIAILKHIKSSESAIGAFMLHPLVQDDDNLVLGINNLFFNKQINPIYITFAVEYRNIANSFLSPMENHPGYYNHNDIKLSPIKCVNDALIADKIQNKKDFDLYHNGTHARSNRLNTYFIRWLKRLNVSDKLYNECIDLCTIKNDVEILET